MKMNPYLKRLKTLKIAPNFWCSDEYFQKAGWQTFETENNRICVMTQENILALPPVELSGLSAQISPYHEVWADLPNYKPEKAQPVFLDYEYLYDPQNFVTMPGKKWAVFRKNSRKFPRRIYEQVDYRPIVNIPGIEDLLSEWVDDITEDTIEDAEIMMKYVFGGEKRGGLYGIRTGHLYGMNIWDSNYQYLNYRYCICRPHFEFLSEHMRWLFYTTAAILDSRLVNDGGTLGRESLKRFKDKLNPVAIRPVYSWKLEESR